MELIEVILSFVTFTFLFVVSFGKLLLIFGQDPASPLMKALCVLLVLSFCSLLALVPFVI